MKTGARARGSHPGAGGGLAGRSAFTLIELVLVIAVMLLAVGALIPLLSNRSDERNLKLAGDEIERMARQARTSAVYQGRAAHISLLEDGFQLVAGRAADASAGDPARRGLFFTERAAAATPPGEAAERPGYSLPDGVAYRIRRWGSEHWREPDGQQWVFQRSGLCEPLTLRIESGESWIELLFSPLTADVQEESYAFR